MNRPNYLLDARERADARAALKLLEGSSITLEEAARIALTGKRILKRTTVSGATDAFLLSRVRKSTRRGKPLRSATIDWYEDFLKPVVRDFGDQFIDGLDRTRFATWLHALKVGETSRAATARACRALWRWCAVQNPPLVSADVTVGLAFNAQTRSERERLVLTVEESAAILAKAGPGRSAVALMLFAGIRPEEIAGRGKEWLRWEHVNTEEKYIRIPDHISKTGKTRLLEHLPDTVWAWLTPGPLRDDVSPCTDRRLRERAREAAGFLDLRWKPVRPWPHDCFRHTAATYLLAWKRDAGPVAEWLGHEGGPSLLHQTYRGVLTTAHTQVNHAEAVRFLALRPAAAR